MRRGFLVLALSTLVGCGGAGSQVRSESPVAPEARPAPPLSLPLPRLAGGSVSLESLRGRPVLLALFTTWCLPCQAEAPLLERLKERFSQSGLVVLGVALDAQGSTPIKLVRLYVEEMGLRFDVLLASPSDPALVAALGQTPLLPRTVLLDRSGRVVLDQAGGTDFQKLETKILAELPAR